MKRCGTPEPEQDSVKILSVLCGLSRERADAQKMCELSAVYFHLINTDNGTAEGKVMKNDWAVIL